jgi:hypothetical protein
MRWNVCSRPKIFRLLTGESTTSTSCWARCPRTSEGGDGDPSHAHQQGEPPTANRTADMASRTSNKVQQTINPSTPLTRPSGDVRRRRLPRRSTHLMMEKLRRKRQIRKKRSIVPTELRSCNRSVGMNLSCMYAGPSDSPLDRQVPRTLTGCVN